MIKRIKKRWRKLKDAGENQNNPKASAENVERKMQSGVVEFM